MQKTLIQTPPLSLYVHVPWCVRKCPYCDFNSHEAGVDLDESAYITALLTDLEQDIGYFSQQEIQTVFFGGGTPSLFSAESIDNILAGIARRIPLTPDCEVTLEANPGTFEQNRFTDYRSAGINRLSIGIQSFADEQLNRLGRIHDRHEAVRAIETARNAGFENINLDLMFGLPGQDLSDAVEDIRLACDLEPSHLSHYQLTIEANTYFHKHTPVLPGTELIWDMQQACHEIMQQHGYAQYEVSAFSQSDRQCRHNINYWTFGDYIGIGAGAHGKSTTTDSGVISRRWKHRQPAAYIDNATQANACSGSSELETADILFEFLMNALRLRRGFSFELFEQRTGIGRERLLDACDRVDEDLLLISETELCTSRRGFDFLNTVLEQFLAH